MSSSQTSSSSISPAAAPASADPVFPGLMDVVARMSVRLGTGTLSVADCLGLRPQSIVRLAQPVGQDLDLSVNGETIARGEVAIIDDSTSIRVTDIIAPHSEGVDA